MHLTGLSIWYSLSVHNAPGTMSGFTYAGDHSCFLMLDFIPWSHIYYSKFFLAILTSPLVNGKLAREEPTFMYFSCFLPSLYPPLPKGEGKAYAVGEFGRTHLVGMTELLTSMDSGPFSAKQ